MTNDENHSVAPVLIARDFMGATPWRRLDDNLVTVDREHAHAHKTIQISSNDVAEVGRSRRKSITFRVLTGRFCTTSKTSMAATAAQSTHHFTLTGVRGGTQVHARQPRTHCVHMLAANGLASPIDSITGGALSLRPRRLTL